MGQLVRGQEGEREREDIGLKVDGKREKREREECFAPCLSLITISLSA